jgi:hypothetical protein
MGRCQINYPTLATTARMGHPEIQNQQPHPPPENGGRVGHPDNLPIENLWKKTVDRRFRYCIYRNTIYEHNTYHDTDD